MRDGTRTGRGGWGKSKKSKPILALPCDAGLKSYPVPAPPPLRDEKNSCRVKWRGAG